MAVKGLKRLISIPRMTYQNFTPIEGWEIYFSDVQRKVLFFVFSGVILHYANQLVVIKDTIFVTKPIFALFIIITPYQIAYI